MVAPAAAARCSGAGRYPRGTRGDAAAAAHNRGEGSWETTFQHDARSARVSLTALP